MLLYLGSGVVTTLVMMLTPVRQGRNPLVADEYAGVARYLLPLLAIIAAVVGWPAVLGLAIKSKLRPEQAWDFTTEIPVFAVTRAHLRERVSIESIEAREVVADPLGAAPHVAFGFLNARWQAFVALREPGDELWAFEVPWERAIRVGYALVRGGNVAAHFHSGCRLDSSVGAAP